MSSAPFRYRLRVRYGECDGQKIVFNSRYGEYADAAMIEYQRKLGGDSAALADNELLFPTEASSKNLSSFGPLSEADEEALDAAFSKVQGN